MARNLSKTVEPSTLYLKNVKNGCYETFYIAING